MFYQTGFKYEYVIRYFLIALGLPTPSLSEQSTDNIFKLKKLSFNFIKAPKLMLNTQMDGGIQIKFVLTQFTFNLNGILLDISSK